MFQTATYGLRGLSKHKQWKPERLFACTVNPHGNMGRQYLADMTFKSKLINIAHIQTAYYADVDKYESIISSYPFHNLSSNCALQPAQHPRFMQKSSECSMIYKIPICVQLNLYTLTFVVCLKHKNYNNIWAVCIRFTQTKNCLNNLEVYNYNLTKQNVYLVILTHSTRRVATIHICNSNCMFENEKV